MLSTPTKLYKIGDVLRSSTKEHTAELVRVGVLYSRDLLVSRQGTNLVVMLANGTFSDTVLPGLSFADEDLPGLRAITPGALSSHVPARSSSQISSTSVSAATNIIEPHVRVAAPSLCRMPASLVRTCSPTPPHP